MRIKRAWLILLIVILTSTQFLFGQTESEQAITYFKKFRDRKSFFYHSVESLPTIDDCKIVFKGKYAFVYFEYISKMKINIDEELKEPNENYTDLRIISFTTEDIQAAKGNYAGGMQRLSEKLQPKITFHKIDYLLEKDLGNSASKYWVKVNDRWVFLPKPWLAFDN